MKFASFVAKATVGTFDLGRTVLPQSPLIDHSAAPKRQR